MGPSEVLICDAAGFEQILDDLARRIADGCEPGVPLGLVGVRTRGVPIADRLAGKLAALLGRPVPMGALDITLYRDDLSESGHWPVLLGTEINFDIDGLDLVLVDDVLYTGRTVRAALNAICDLGRPARVRLAALVDRGHRELPIRADLVGISLPTRRNEMVKVRVRPTDPVDEVIRVARDATTPNPQQVPR